MEDEGDDEAVGGRAPPAAGALVLPGSELRSAATAVKGRGTYEARGRIFSSLVGRLSLVDQLVYVSPLGAAPYVPEVGDVVVGRVAAVGGDRWAVDVGAALRAVLPLGHVPLAEREPRRRTHADALDMRIYFREADVVCLEVQRVSAEGLATLHCRNAQHSVLRNGVLVALTSGAVVASRRLANRTVALPADCGGATVVFGANGRLWVGAGSRPSPADRCGVARAVNAVAALDRRGLPVTPEAVIFICRATADIHPKELLLPEVSERECEKFVDAAVAEDDASEY